MTIYSAFDATGGFIAGDTDSGVTCYAYFSSIHAVNAMRKPEATAREMLERESVSLRHACPSIARDYDAYNWSKLAALVL